MKQMFDFDLDNIPQNSYTRTSRSNSRNKSEEGCPISKIEDFQTSMSAFSTRIESKYNKNNSDNNNHKKKKIMKELLILKENALKKYLMIIM